MSAVKYAVGAAAAAGLIYLLTKKKNTSPGGSGSISDPGSVSVDPGTGTVVVQLPTAVTDALQNMVNHNNTTAGGSQTPVVIVDATGTPAAVVPSGAITTGSSHPTSGVLGRRYRSRVGLVQKCDCAKGGSCNTTDGTCACCDSKKVVLRPHGGFVQLGLVQKCDCARGGSCNTTDGTCACCDSKKISLPYGGNPRQLMAYGGYGL